MIKVITKLIFLLSFSVYIGCEEAVPKPIGYFRFDSNPVMYESVSNTKQVAFEINGDARMENLKSMGHNESFILNYSKLNAVLLCSYISFDEDQFFQYSEESRNLVYQHTAVASEINEQSFALPEKRLFGKLYDLSGQVATPIQFELTDSTSRFFRGSLLFNCTPNQDSLKPYVRYIKEDVLHLIQSFYWKK